MSQDLEPGTPRTPLTPSTSSASSSLSLASLNSPIPTSHRTQELTLNTLAPHSTHLANEASKLSRHSHDSALRARRLRETVESLQVVVTTPERRGDNADSNSASGATEETRVHPRQAREWSESTPILAGRPSEEVHEREAAQAAAAISAALQGQVKVETVVPERLAPAVASHRKLLQSAELIERRLQATSKRMAKVSERWDGLLHQAEAECAEERRELFGDEENPQPSRGAGRTTAWRALGGTVTVAGLAGATLAAGQKTGVRLDMAKVGRALAPILRWLRAAWHAFGTRVRVRVGPVVVSYLERFWQWLRPLLEQLRPYAQHLRVVAALITLFGAYKVISRILHKPDDTHSNKQSPSDE